MKRIDIERLSDTYQVRALKLDDVPMILGFCREQTQYYAYCGEEITAERIEHDLLFVPPGFEMERKFYVGFFEGDKLTAVMDFLYGYPDDACAFIGFFMVRQGLQGRGVGSRIAARAFEYLKAQDIETCRLAIDGGNPQSKHFWRKNGFDVVNTVRQEEGTILVAEKRL